MAYNNLKAQITLGLRLTYPDILAIIGITSSK